MTIKTSVLVNDERVPDFTLNFHVPENEITQFYFNSYYDGNYNTTMITGNLSINGRLDKESLQAGVDLKTTSGRVYNIKWSSWNNSNWNFEFGPLVDEDIKGTMTMEFEKESLYLRKADKREIIVQQAHSFNLDSVYWEQLKLKNLLVLNFDSSLNKFQNLNGLIKITPSLPFSTTIRNNMIYLNGDFKPGHDYTVNIASAVYNCYDTKLAEAQKRTTTAPQLQPLLEYTDNGSLLTSLNKNKVSVNVVNLKKLNLTVKRIYENNLTYFLDFNSLEGEEDYYYYRNDNIQYYGETVINKEIELDIPANELKRIDLDLSELNDAGQGNIYVIEVQDQENWNTKKKVVIQSDMAVTLFKGAKENIVVVRDVTTGKPIEDAEIELISPQHVLLETGKTDKMGMISLPADGKEIQYVTAKKADRLGILIPNSMMWNISTFDTGGIETTRDLLLHTYTDRKVYRPGEEVCLGIIARNSSGRYPENLPITVTVLDNESRKVSEEVIKENVEGFFLYRYKTSETDMTGNWNFSIKAGTGYVNEGFSLQPVMANRITVNVETDKKVYKGNDKVIKVKAQADYLFGKSAAELPGSLTLRLTSYLKSFKTWSDFTFYDSERLFAPVDVTLLTAKTDEAGILEGEWNIPEYPNLPSALNFFAAGEVSENERPVKTTQIVTYEKYDRYVGLKSQGYYLNKGDKSKFETILVDSEGNAVAGETLSAKVYFQEYNWWYSTNSTKVSFKEDYNTTLLYEKELRSSTKPISFEYTPELEGRYLIEISYSNGHAATLERQTSWWNSEKSSMRSEGLITLRSDKAAYSVGDKARITFPAPDKGELLYTITKDGVILKKEIGKLKSKKNEATIEIDITKDMLPNCYLTVSIIQSIQETMNDRPIRMFGVIPINAESPETHLDFTLNVPEKIKPNSKLTCRIQMTEKIEVPFTIYVIDEGLVTLTPYRISDPWTTFYAKRRLQMMPYDNYPWFIGLPKGDAFKTFSVGGDMLAMRAGGSAEAMKLKEEVGNDEILQRFNPLALCQGVLLTDANGFAEVSFDIPDYQGAVRVIAVATKGNSYGKREKTVKVLDDMIIMPTLPRVLHTGDLAEIPVSIFAVDKNMQDVSLSVTTGGYTNIQGSSNLLLRLDSSKQGKKVITLKAAKPGQERLTFTATSNGKTVQISKILPVISGSVVTSKTREVNLSAPLTLMNPDTLAYHQANLYVHDLTMPNIYKHMDYLTGYPYGCSEQMISRAFPQLYLKTILPEEKDKMYRSELIVSETIKHLTRVQRFDGSISLWFNSEPNEFLNNYALHFLVAAEAEGYHVPGSLKTQLTDYISQFVTNLDLHSYHKYNCYSVYVLAKAGKAPMGPMNYIKEEMLSKLDVLDKWLLAASFELAGLHDTAMDITSKLPLSLNSQDTDENFFASPLRDNALLLNCLIDLKDNKQTDIYKSMIRDMESKDYLSTQELSFCLLATGRYLQAHPFKGDERGKLVLVDRETGKTVEVSLSGRLNKIDLSGKHLEISFNPAKLAEKYALSLEERYKTLLPVQIEKSEGLTLHYNIMQNGVRVAPESIKPGDRFSIVVGVELPKKQLKNNFVVSVPLPSCWEPDQVKLLDPDTSNLLKDIELTVNPTDLESSRKKFNVAIPSHQEIRDDRVLIFFDVESYNPAFVIDLVSVTKGEFEMAPITGENMYDSRYQASTPGLKIINK
jgi:uncharacterized protein YfaS (alpha-2-macroglobulin family)